MSAGAIIAIAVPVVALALRLLGKWLYKRLTGADDLKHDLDQNADVVGHGNKADINAVLDDRLNGLRD